MGKVTELYADVSGHVFREWEKHQLEPDALLERLKLDGNIEYRFGSHLTMHSKLWIQQGAGLVRFRFDANMQNDDIDYQKEGKPMEDEFKSEINKLLLESGLGEPLPDYYR